jgi:hypothetical protein
MCTATVHSILTDACIQQGILLYNWDGSTSRQTLWVCADKWSHICPCTGGGTNQRNFFGRASPRTYGYLALHFWKENMHPRCHPRMQDSYFVSIATIYLFTDDGSEVASLMSK